MKISINYKGKISKAIGCVREAVEMMEVDTIEDVIQQLILRYGSRFREEALVNEGKLGLMILLNKQLANIDQRLYDGDELTFISPIYGG